MLCLGVVLSSSILAGVRRGVMSACLFPFFMVPCFEAHHPYTLSSFLLSPSSSDLASRCLASVYFRSLIFLAQMFPRDFRRCVCYFCRSIHARSVSKLFGLLDRLLLLDCVQWWLCREEDPDRVCYRLSYLSRSETVISAVVGIDPTRRYHLFVFRSVRDSPPSHCIDGLEFIFSGCFDKLRGHFTHCSIVNASEIWDFLVRVAHGSLLIVNA